MTTVIENYTIANKNSTQLDELQGWVKKQSNLSKEKNGP